MRDAKSDGFPDMAEEVDRKKMKREKMGESETTKEVLFILRVPSLQYVR